MNCKTVNKRWLSLAALFIAVCSCNTAVVLGDAIVVTKAMTASTIAEVFIEQEQVRVEFEIGVADIQAFKNVLPDELFEKLTGDSISLAEREQVFLDSDWQLMADGERLQGNIERVELVKRVVRDEVTGDPLVDQPEDAEIVVRVVLNYPLKGEPKTLSVEPLLNDSGATTATIGFICYHRGLPVNDFRYLPAEATVDLDWEDPWYSRFRHRNLRRQFDAPLSVFLYVEPYEVRKEIIVRPKDLEGWIDLGIEGAETIPVEKQAELKAKVAEFLSTKSPVKVDGKFLEGRLNRIHFIRRSLRKTGIVEPPEEMDATSATLGVIYVYPIAKLPERVSLEWELFSEKIEEVPAVATDEAGGLPSRVTAENRTLEWQNFLTNPSQPGMVDITKPRERKGFAVPVVSLLCGGVFLLMLVTAFKHKGEHGSISQRGVAAMVAVLVCGLLTLPIARVVVANPFTQKVGIGKEEAEPLVAGLLYNVYRAFDHHDESLIYDRLAQSIDGELLGEVYLDTRRSIEVKNQGGLRVSVKEVTVSELEPLTNYSEDGQQFRCRWRVAGSIGHWGHIHRRVNEQLAELTIEPCEGEWKIVKLVKLDEQAVE